MMKKSTLETTFVNYNENDYSIKMVFQLPESVVVVITVGLGVAGIAVVELMSI